MEGFEGHHGYPHQVPLIDTRTFPVQTKQGPFPLKHDGKKGRPPVTNELITVDRNCLV